MGMTGALKLRQIVENVERIVAIELMCAAQALEFRRPLQSSAQLERMHAAVRAVVPRLEQDRTLAPDIDALAAAVRKGAFNAWCDQHPSKERELHRVPRSSIYYEDNRGRRDGK